MRIFLTIFLTFLFAAAAFGQQNLRPGQAAPDFAASALDGTTYNLKDLQGKVVVLTFWSTRCEICRAEIPKLNGIASRYKGKDVVFLALTMENQAKIEPFLRKNPFNFSILPNGFGVVLKYANLDASGNINMGFPSYFVINKKGAIESRAEGWDKSGDLEARLSRLLGE